MISNNSNNLKGRAKIFANVKEITKENIIEVLQDAMKTHKTNRDEIQFLIDYERGEQPLQRNKVVRSDIDINVVDNIANFVKEFNIGYFWASPIMLVQRGNVDFHATDPDIDDTAVSALNEMLRNGEDISYKDICTAEFVEICGIGHKLVDVRTVDEMDGTSYVHDYSLDSRYAFIVYANDVAKSKLMGVTFSEDEDNTYYTCFTNDKRYEITNDEVTSVDVNPLGMIPIVEFERSVDRTGCFERRISEMDALNVMVSDFTNNVAQSVQEIWWGNDIDFPVDDNGDPKPPASNQWLLTYSNQQGNDPKVMPLSSNFDSNSTLNAISGQRNWILQKCKVPMQYENSGGGSTGVATDMSSGWASTELEAMKKEQLTEKAKREELKLILKAIELVPFSELEANNPLRMVHLSDVDFHFNRRKNYDMSIKANTFAVYISHGINGRHALKLIDAFPDPEQVWVDSKEAIEKYQESLWQTALTGDSETNSSDDTSNQTEQSPILDKLG